MSKIAWDTHKRFFADITKSAHDDGLRDSCADDELIGMEEPLQCIRDVLNHKRDPHFFSPKNVALLYGRKGAGKARLIQEFFHRNNPDACVRTADGGFGRSYQICEGWKMQEWNWESFIKWSEAVVACMEENPAGYNGSVFVIQNLHLIINLSRAGRLYSDVISALVRILSAVRLPRYADNHFKVILTMCDVPSDLPREVQAFIDVNCYVQPLSPSENRRLFYQWMNDFKTHVQHDKQMKNLSWSIDMAEDAPEKDLDHILNVLSLASNGASPREIQEFMLSVNDACANPKKDGSTDYNDEIICKFLHQVNGLRSITAYDADAENASFRKYAGLDEVTAKDQDTVRIGVDGQVRMDPLNQALKDPGMARPGAARESNKEELHKTAQKRERHLENSERRKKEMQGAEEDEGDGESDKKKIKKEGK